ncbi:MAG: S8 family peptidase, partial [Gammaproteobacteria bacterium]
MSDFDKPHDNEDKSMLNFPHALCVIFFAVLTACGGGGSASAPTTTTPNPPAPPSVVLPAPNAPTTVNWRDDEFAVNYGLGQINADAAYQRGYYGQGATVAVVDSGVRASHNNFSGSFVVGGNTMAINPILSGAARRFDAGGTAYMDGALSDPDGHGTGVAAIIAGTFDTAADPLGHGVAPLAKILPLRISDDDGDLVGATAAFRYAIDNNVHIINNSFGPTYPYIAISDGDTRRASIFAGPVVPQILQVPGLMGPGSIILNRMRDHATIFRGRDVAVVWAAGNHGWNSETGIVAVTIHEEFSVTTDLTNGITVSADVVAMTTTFSPRYLADNFNVLIPANGAITTISGFEANGVSDYGLAPIYHPELRGRWLAVVNTDSDNRIWRESNGCGSQAKYWCLAAPGVGINAANRGNDDDLSSWTGTSQSAPHVSGALALLKSRLPNMPMSVLVHLLLTTATDLGVAGVDDVYGHGLVNVSAAINRQGNIRLQSASSQGVLLQNANMELPSSFAGFAKRLNGVGVAAEYLDGFYYDAPLGGMVRTQSKKQKPLNFAAEMFDGDTAINEDGVFAFSRNGALRSAGWKKGAFQVRHYFHNKPSLWQSEGGDIVRRPFFADDGGYSDEIQMAIGDNLQLFAARGEEQKAEYSQMGISWRRSLSSIPKLRLAAAHSHIS